MIIYVIIKALIALISDILYYIITYLYIILFFAILLYNLKMKIINNKFIFIFFF